MLGFLKKSKEADGGIFAPVNGTCVDITSVPDQTFATKVLGEGVAFIYDGDTIYAPCSGIIRVVASTKHAVGIVNEAGIELLLITIPLALIVIGPIAVALQNLIGLVVTGLIGLNAGIAGLILGTFWSVLVMFGLHWGVIPMFALNVSNYGYDVVNPLIFSGAWASMGAVLGVIVRSKSAQERNIAIPALISTFFGVNEPTLYGILVPRKKIMWTTFISAGIGSSIAGFAGAKLYEFGASGPLGTPCFINPEGIDAGFIGLIIGAIVSLVLAFVAALIIGDKKEQTSIKKKAL